MRNLFTVLILLFLGTAVKGENLKGYVYSKTNGEAIEYANVALYNLPDTTFTNGCVTDNNGFFYIENISQGSYVLKVTYVGYKDFTEIIRTTDETPFNIQIEEDSKHLDNITVMATRPLFKLTDNGILVNVAQTALSKENSSLDVLRKIPGLTLNSGKLEAFGLGTPLIYINDKKVMDFSEVERLTVKDIKSIKFISNPGAEYDASGKAVILITVHNPQDGLKFQLKTKEEQGQQFSYTNGLNLDYQYNKLNVFGAYEYSDQGTSSNNHNITGIQIDTLWKYDMLEDVNERTKNHTYQIGGNYKINDAHTLNIQYNGFSSDSKTYKKSINTIDANTIDFNTIDLEGTLNAKSTLHHLSAFYKGDWSSRLTFRLYADYINKYSRQLQQVAESDRQQVASTIATRSLSNFNLYAVNPTLTYTFSKNSQLLLGGDWHSVSGDNSLFVQNTPFAGASSNTKEDKQALYLNYTNGNDLLSFSAGLRYEHLKSEMTDKINPANNQKRHYNNLFPSLNLNYSLKATSHSLAYTVKTTRPDYDVLNTNVYYTNRFNYMIGNPSINPAIWHNISYSFIYKFIYFNMIYSNMKNYIGYTYYADPANPSVIVTSYANYDRFQQLAAILNLQYQINHWQPSLMFYFLKPFFTVDYMGEKVKNNQPVLNIIYNNGFELPWKLTLNAEYQYSSSCNYLMFKLKPTHQINLSLQRMFLNEQLQVSLEAQDIFKGNNFNYTGKINNITFDHNEYADNQRFSIHIIYRFNNYKKKTTKNNVNEELNRLK